MFVDKQTFSRAIVKVELLAGPYRAIAVRNNEPVQSSRPSRFSKPDALTRRNKT